MSEAPRQKPSSPGGAARRLLSRAESGDALLFLYALAFARQYLWMVEGNAAAWGLSAALASLGLAAYVLTKPFAPEPVGRSFWLVVALPLALVYALRAPFPDFSFDVLNYRLFHAERSLDGPLFAAGDFFPTPAPYNPAPDTVTGLARHLLGYRLGTIVNLFALVWAAQIADRILRPLVSRAWVRAACVLLVMLAEHVLFEVNTYMADLLALPLLFEATRLTLRAREAGNGRGLFVRVALLVGAAAAFKLTNLVVALPLVAVCVWEAAGGPRRLAAKELLKTALLSAVAFAAPLLPFAVYLYIETDNPAFPLLNGLFKSPYWPTHGGWDSRWGPHGVWETVVWPFVAFFEPGRHSELAVYSGRLAVGFAVSLAGLWLARGDRLVRTLCAVNLAGCLLWSAAGMGYSRYGLYLELLSGVSLVAVAATLARGARPAGAPLKLAAAGLFVALLAAQAALAARYVLRYEWSMRPTALSDFPAYKHEARHLLRDHSLAAFLPTETREALAGVGLWVETAAKSNGFEVLLDARAPALGARHHEFFVTRAARRRFTEAVASARGRRAVSLCFPEDLKAATEAVGLRGLQVARATPVEVPFFSSRRRMGMMLLEISLPEGPEVQARLEEFWRGAAFSDEDYRADITALDPPAAMRPGERRALRFRVRNLGREAWPARGAAGGRFQVNIGDRWLDASGRRVVNDLDGRTALAADLAPGAEAEMVLHVTAPREPGSYVLDIDMIHEGVTFFREKGSQSLLLPVRVEP